MKIALMTLVFNDVSMNWRDVPKLRGFFAGKYRDNIAFHNHFPGGEFRYAYPVIQYRLIRSHPALLAVNDGVDLVKKVLFDTDNITIGNTSIRIHEKEVTFNEHEIAPSENCISYSFLTPWMALNEQNFTFWKQAETYSQKQLLLERILIGNIKSLCKGLGYWIQQPEKLKVKGSFTPVTVAFKNKQMVCFKGRFLLNFKIPDMLGLGKQSARGFGVVQRVI